VFFLGFSFRAFRRVSWRFALLGAVACTPKIGDKCQVSTDCSVQGDRLCDISQPDGYCTQLNCHSASCPPDEGSCVLFDSAIPGCGFDDRASPLGSRVARSSCIANCTTNNDCRSGYVCADPRQPPFYGFILDDDQTKLTCLPIPVGPIGDAGADAAAGDAGDAGGASVCQAVGPTVPTIDAGPAQIGDGGLVVPPLLPSSRGAH
jgi:hypothetical protein